MKAPPKHLLFLICVGCGPTGIQLDKGSSATEPDTGANADPSDTSTDSGTDSSTDTGTPSETTFVPMPDLASCCECDPFAQDCSEGEKCVPYGSPEFSGHKCVPVLGEQMPGEPCTYAGPLESTDDCDATSFCHGADEVDGELIGTCHSFCQGTPDTPECPEGSTCQVDASGSLGICIQVCDPIAQDCLDGDGCYWGNADFICVATQGPGIADGQPCGYINDCTPGSMCAAAEVFPECNGSACCSPFCDLGLDDAQCASLPGTVCMAFFEEGSAPPGYDDVGVCILGP